MIRAGRRRRDTQRTREAAHWYIENEAGSDLSERFLSDWGKWVDGHRNRHEYDEVAKLGQAMRALPRPRAATQSELLEDVFEGAESAASVHFSRVRGTASNVRFRAASLWVATLMAMVCVFALLCFAVAKKSVDERNYVTGLGEQMEISLPDGSQMTLGGNTAVSVRFTKKARGITLLRGEGMFRVAQDVQRPFNVCAAEGCTTALGTVFDVRIYSNRVRVWVQSGAVEVAPASPREPGSRLAAHVSSAWIPTRLAHDQEVSYDKRAGAGKTSATDSSVAAAWTRGSLIYRGRPLVEVIEDVQRYSMRPLLLDPAAADLEFSGSVVQGYIDQWVRGLPTIFPVETLDCGHKASRRVSACNGHPEGLLIRLRIPS